MPAGLAAPAASTDVETLAARFAGREARVGIIGLGYVGLPLADAICRRGFRVVGFDIDPAKVATLKAGHSYIQHIGEQSVAALVAEGRFEPTTDFSRLGDVG